MDQMDNSAVDLPLNEHIQDTTDTQFIYGVRKELDFGQTSTIDQTHPSIPSPAQPETLETEFYMSQTFQPEPNPSGPTYPENSQGDPPQFGKPPQTDLILPETENFHMEESNFASET